MAVSSSQLHGTPVGEDEDLYRALTNQKWWKEKENRISTAALSFPFFSVDVASVAQSIESTLKRFDPGTGLASFVCGQAKQEGCRKVQFEQDEKYPDNDAHAHVYMPAQNAERKKVARRLVTICTLLVKPNLPDPDLPAP